MRHNHVWIQFAAAEHVGAFARKGPAVVALHPGAGWIDSRHDGKPQTRRVVPGIDYAQPMPAAAN